MAEIKRRLNLAEVNIVFPQVLAEFGQIEWHKSNEQPNEDRVFLLIAMADSEDSHYSLWSDVKTFRTWEGLRVNAAEEWKKYRAECEAEGHRVIAWAYEQDIFNALIVTF